MYPLNSDSLILVDFVSLDLVLYKGLVNSSLLLTKLETKSRVQ